MKKIYAILLAVLPLVGFSQDVIWDFHGDTIKSADLGADVEFDYTLTNNTNGDLDLKWRLFEDFSTVPNWEDNICEGVLICWPSSVRANEITIAAGDDLDIYHHVVASVDTGVGYSKFCLFDPTDSANTIECHTMQVHATLPDTMQISVNGQTAYVIDGDTFEVFGGEYVPLGLEDLAGLESGLSQNAPNPFSGNTTIQYTMTAESGSVKFHDLTGKLVKEVVLTMPVGQLTVDGDLEAGIYFYSLWENGQMVDSKRMQVID